MVKKALILFISLLLFVSCAVHDKFPFICFRWSCIAAEFKLPSFKATGSLKKQRKAKASLRKKKRQRAKNKRLREKGIAVPDINTTADAGETAEKADSLKYKFKALQEDKYIIISFNRKDLVKTDSLFVRYNADGDDMLEYDKQVIKNYLDSTTVEKIILINVREHVGDKKEDDKHNKHASTVKEHVAQYFVQIGIPRDKIKTLSR